MKILHHISSLNRRNQYDSEVIDQVHNNINNNKRQNYNNNDNSINYIQTITSTNISPDYKVYGPDNSFESGLSWKIPAILVLVWTVILILVVFLFIIKKTVFAKFNLQPVTNQNRHIPNVNPENEWMIASFEEDDSEDVPLSTDISRDSHD
ncbi:hypothetical protein C1645_837451 [Glomus cerebriforme]|uniref:Uncharacterized protein n=1 Tax=Glomus cerebriforme TaxID=658196 RepID=A0A397S8K8_9GLOM|nr:hypothetical protein C1645_837451 [Glomus cerebriforme]